MVSQIVVLDYESKYNTIVLICSHAPGSRLTHSIRTICASVIDSKEKKYVQTMHIPQIKRQSVQSDSHDGL